MWINVNKTIPLSFFLQHLSVIFSVQTQSSALSHQSKLTVTSWLIHVLTYYVYLWHQGFWEALALKTELLSNNYIRLFIKNMLSSSGCKRSEQECTGYTGESFYLPCLTFGYVLLQTSVGFWTRFFPASGSEPRIVVSTLSSFSFWQLDEKIDTIHEPVYCAAGVGDG